MKINPIINLNVKNNIQKKSLNTSLYYKNDSVSFVNTQVSFCGIKEFMDEKIEKMQFKQDAKSIQKNASLIFAQSKTIQEEADNYIQDSRQIVDDSKAILRKAYVLYADMIGPLESAQENNIVSDIQGDKRKCYSKDSANTQLITEFLGDRVTKRAVIDNDYISIYVYSPLDTKKHYKFDRKTEKLIEYCDNTKYSAVGYKASDRYTFSDDKLSTYEKDYKVKYSSYEIASQRFVFDKREKLSEFSKGYSDDFSGVLSLKENYYYSDNSLLCHTKGFKAVNDVCESSDEIYNFLDGALYMYQKSNTQDYNGDDTTQILYEYYNSKLFKAMFNSVLHGNGAESADKIIKCNYNTGNIREYALGMNIDSKDDGDTVTYSKRVIFKER